MSGPLIWGEGYARAEGPAESARAPSLRSRGAPPRAAGLHPSEHHAPRRLHERGMLCRVDVLVHLDACAAAVREDPQVRRHLGAGHRNVVVVEVPSHRNEVDLGYRFRLAGDAIAELFIAP